MLSEFTLKWVADISCMRKGQDEFPNICFHTNCTSKASLNLKIIIWILKSLQMDNGSCSQSKLEEKQSSDCAWGFVAAAFVVCNGSASVETAVREAVLFSMRSWCVDAPMALDMLVAVKNEGEHSGDAPSGHSRVVYYENLWDVNIRLACTWKMLPCSFFSCCQT